MKMFLNPLKIFQEILIPVLLLFGKKYNTCRRLTKFRLTANKVSSFDTKNN